MSNQNLLSPDPLDRTEVQIAFEVLVATLICVLSVIGNTLVVYVIYLNSRLHSVTNMFVMNLACSDIAMALGQMPLWIVSLVKGRWLFGRTGCYVAVFLQLTFGIASLQTLALIALNRYYKIVKPSHISIFADRKKAKILILFSWLTPALFGSAPALYGWGDVKYYEQASMCAIEWDIRHISYIVVVLGAGANSVMLVILCCYYKIYRAVRSAAASVAAHATAEIPQNTLNRSNRKAENSLIRTSFLVVCIYSMCWMPVNIIAMIEIANIAISRWLPATAIYFMFVNSCANPLIYGLRNPQFRKAYRDVFKCCLPQRTVPANGTKMTLTARVHTTAMRQTTSAWPATALSVQPAESTPAQYLIHS